MSVLTAFVREAVVERYGTFGRCVCLGVKVAQGTTVFVRVVGDEFLESLDIFRVELVVAYVRLIYEEHDLSLFGLGSHAFELVGSYNELCEIVCKKLNSADTFCENVCFVGVLEVGGVLAFTFETKLEGSHLSFRLVGERYGVSNATTVSIADNLIVVFHLFALNVLGSTYHLAAVVFENGSHFGDTFYG